MRICLVLEGCYPYVFGGVSTWMHQYINQMQEHEFVLWVIGANAEKRGKFVYELPENVVEVHEVFLDDALQVKEKGKMSHIFSEKELESLSELMQMRRPDWETLFSLYHDKHLNPMAFLKSETFLELLIKICKEQYPYIAFADAFHGACALAQNCGAHISECFGMEVRMIKRLKAGWRRALGYFRRNGISAAAWAVAERLWQEMQQKGYRYPDMQYLSQEQNYP